MRRASVFEGCRWRVHFCGIHLLTGICDFAKCNVKSWEMKIAGSFLLALAAALPALGQRITDPHVTNPGASVVDVAARQAALKSTADPLLLSAIRRLQSCAATPLVPAPTGRMDIPHHYLSGSNGPVNPKPRRPRRSGLRDIREPDYCPA